MYFVIQHSWLKTHKQLLRDGTLWLIAALRKKLQRLPSHNWCESLVNCSPHHIVCLCVCVHVCVTLQAEKTDKEKQVCLFIITSTLLLFCFSLLSLRILCTQHILEAQNIFLPSVQPFKGPVLCKFSDLLCFTMTSTGATLHRRKKQTTTKKSPEKQII